MPASSEMTTVVHIIIDHDSEQRPRSFNTGLRNSHAVTCTSRPILLVGQAGGRLVCRVSG
jgi:hypothetical protein